MSVFQKFPQFINTDVRQHRQIGYGVNADFMSARYEILLPTELVQGKTVLDLGCCVGSAGAWVLDRGAESYTGVEVQSTMSDLAAQNLAQCYPDNDWTIIETSFAEFFQSNTTKYDIVIALGVVYSSVEYQIFLKSIVDICKEHIVYDSYTATPNQENIPMTVYKTVGMPSEDQYNLMVEAALPNYHAVKMLMAHWGFGADDNIHSELKILPIYNTASMEKQNTRYGTVFTKTAYQDTSFNSVYKDADKQVVQDWSFDKNVAQTFVAHAKRHIPDYDKVINLSRDLCWQLLPDAKNDCVIDVGCATGETINRFYRSGMRNLVGVDCSQPMIDQCNPDHSKLILNQDFPIGTYSAVICNWTLHFIKDKIAYLQSIYQNLKPGGFLVLSDKTCNTGIDLELYHTFKQAQGVTPEEIAAKAASVKNIMFINDPMWYINTLKELGFVPVTVVNAAPCFTTFLAHKP
jgi:tRNA (cmo5U34)-methyltransferase